jgi:SAM-dependent methyltransferase
VREDDPPLSPAALLRSRSGRIRRRRPPYPARVYEILEWCGLGPGSRVLEIGPGTGLATAPLLSRGADVVAVEPGRGLAAALRERLDTDRLAVIEADLEHAELPAGPYDLAVAATSFHWVDTSVALPKLAALLRPKGWLVVWWNVFADPHRPRVPRGAGPALRRRLPGERRGPGDTANPVRSGLARGRQASARRLVRRGHRGAGPVDPPDHCRGRAAAVGISQRHGCSARARRRFLADLAATVEDFGGAVDDPYVTAVYRTRPVARMIANYHQQIPS